MSFIESCVLGLLLLLLLLQFSLERAFVEVVVVVVMVVVMVVVGGRVFGFSAFDNPVWNSLHPPWHTLA